MKKLLFIGLIASLLHADITHVGLWSKTTESGAQQHIITCGDRHNVRKKGAKQIEQLVELLKNISANRSIVIEDALNYTKTIQVLHDIVSQKNELLKDLQDFQDTMNHYREQDVADGAISNIVVIPEHACKNNIDCINVEFRQLVTFQLLDLIELIDEHGISHQDVIQALIKDIIKKIESFDDTPALNTFYSSVIDRFKPLSDCMGTFFKSGSPMQDFPAFLCEMVLADPSAFDLSALSYESPHQELIAYAHALQALQQSLQEGAAIDKQNLLKQIRINFVCHAFSALIDALMLHEVHLKYLAAQEESVICLSAGLGHIVHIESILPELGYTRMVEHHDADGVDFEHVLFTKNNAIEQMDWLQNLVSMFASIMAWLGLHQ